MTTISRRTYAWTGTPNASPSTMAVNGATVYTNVAHDGLRTGYNGTTLGADVTDAATGQTWHQATFVAGNADGALRWGLNGSGIADGTPIAFSICVRNPGASTITVTVDVGDRNTVTVDLGAGAETTLSTSWNPPKDGTFQFADLTVTTAGATVWYRLATAVVGTIEAVRPFDGNSPSVAVVGADSVVLSTRLATVTGSSVPLLMTVYTVDRVTQNTVHEILGRSDPDVTFGSTQTRSGTFTVLYETVALAAAARDMLSAPGAVTLTQSDMPDLSMQFVVTGTLSMQPDDQDRDMWTLTVPFREVIA